MFSTGYCSYLRVYSVLVLTKPIIEIEMISIITQQDVLFYLIPNRSLEEKIDNFLKLLEKTSKKQFINTSKQKQYMYKSDPKTVVISTSDDSKKEGLLIFILEIKISIPETK